MTRQSLVIPGWHPPQFANGSHGHWRAKWEAKRDAGWLAALVAQTQGWRFVPGKVRLEIVLVYPRKYRVDSDNLHARCKGLIDGLKAEFFTDDSTDWLELHVTATVEKGVKETRVTLAPAEAALFSSLVRGADAQEVRE